MIKTSKTANTPTEKGRERMKLTADQDIIVGKAFMTAMARKLYREGSIDAATLNRLVSKIDKLKEIKRKPE